MKNIYYFLCILMSFNLIMCSDDHKDYEQERFFLVTPTELAKIPVGGSKVNFTIKASKDWSYSLSSLDWIVEESKSEESLVLTVQKNTSSEERVATLTFKSTLPNRSYDVKILQEGIVVGKVILADLLDLKFKADGTAEDVSPAKNEIITFEGNAMSTVYSNTYQRYIANFTQELGGNATSGFYKFDYANNQIFRNAMANGHSLEAVFMLDANQNELGKEIKMFSSHQGGGTGLMISDAGRGNAITFLPHVGGSYRWANSGVVPERGKYYHVIGVWDKVEGKAYVYVNGRLRGRADAQGELTLASDGCKWFTIGGDPGSETLAQSAWKGDVSIVRIYDKALDAEAVGELWGQLKDFKPSPLAIKLLGVSIPSKRVQVNSTYSIKGEGFNVGDKIKIESMSKAGIDYEIEGTVNGNALDIVLPQNLVTGKYRFYVLRGTEVLDIGFATLSVIDETVKSPKVIAHRGFFVQADGAAVGVAENSVAALAEAQRIGVYGSEFDVHITADDKLVIHHDPTIRGIVIEDSGYDAIKDFTIGSGNHVEKLPTLGDYLIQGKKNTKTKLILELKGRAENMNRLCEACVSEVRAAGMVEHTEYIAFNLDACKKIRELEPTATVAYLNGDLSPQKLKPLGIHLDYAWQSIKGNIKWLSDAQEIGLKVNVWTVNSENDLRDAIEAGVDYITTDYPVLTQQLISGEK